MKQMRSLQRINVAMSRAAATAPLRQIDPTIPGSWEFCGFSQHGEDGIIDYLTRRLRVSNHFFIEVGAADGLENNSSWLALARSFSGLMIDGSVENSAWCKYLLTPMNYGVEILQMFVTRENVKEIAALACHRNPDVFSLDIDGNDYFIAEAVLECGLRPKIWVVEYNSAFGPERSISIRYQESFCVRHEGSLSLYCGCSITAWKKLMNKHEYQFVTVDSSGVNAIFIDRQEFEAEFVQKLRGMDFLDNISHTRQFRNTWREQFELIKDMEFVEVGG